jgi:hypothetical protein
VRWNYYYRGFDDQESMSTSMSLGWEVDDDSSTVTTDIHMSAFTTELSVASGIGADDPLFVFAVLRDAANAADDLDGDAGLVGVKVKWYANKLIDE